MPRRTPRKRTTSAWPPAVGGPPAAAASGQATGLADPVAIDSSYATSDDLSYVSEALRKIRHGAQSAARMLDSFDLVPETRAASKGRLL